MKIMSKCKSCGAEIMWIQTVNGKPMPCDPKPIPFVEDKTGSLTLVTKDGRVVRAKADASSDEFGYVSHFATCPNANQHRKKTKAMPMEDWLRGCVYHDGRKGYVSLPADKVMQIADYIQTTRKSGTDGMIEIPAPERR